MDLYLDWHLYVIALEIQATVKSWPSL